MHLYKLLPFHPPPKPDETIGQWIERLAKANLTSFKVMFCYIQKLAIEIGFLQSLNMLTGFPLEQISRLLNEFKPEFWKKKNHCPIKNCDYKNNTR